jgi:hypothetical protein
MKYIKIADANKLLQTKNLDITKMNKLEFAFYRKVLKKGYYLPFVIDGMDVHVFVSISELFDACPN